MERQLSMVGTVPLSERGTSEHVTAESPT